MVSAREWERRREFRLKSNRAVRMERVVDGRPRWVDTELPRGIAMTGGFLELPDPLTGWYTIRMTQGGARSWKRSGWTLTWLGYEGFPDRWMLTAPDSRWALIRGEAYEHRKEIIRQAEWVVSNGWPTYWEVHEPDYLLALALAQM